MIFFHHSNHQMLVGILCESLVVIWHPLSQDNERGAWKNDNKYFI